MDQIDILLKRIDEILATGDKEGLLKLNKQVNYKLEELVRSFSIDVISE